MLPHPIFDKRTQDDVDLSRKQNKFFKIEILTLIFNISYLY